MPVLRSPFRVSTYRFFSKIAVKVDILVLRLKFLDPSFTWTKSLRFDDFYFLNKLLQYLPIGFIVQH